jgi:hypothetical protein
MKTYTYDTPDGPMILCSRCAASMRKEYPKGDVVRKAAATAACEICWDGARE